MKRSRRTLAACQPADREKEAGFVDGLPAKAKATNKAGRMVRVGWREAAQAIAAAGDDVLRMDDFGSGGNACAPWVFADR